MRKVKVGDVVIGGDDIVVQSMWESSINGVDLNEVCDRLDFLHRMGCKLMRFAANDMETISNLGFICKNSVMPIVADIHFDYRLALAAVDAGVSKIRINPGNIGSEEKVLKVLQKCKNNSIPIRVGINTGSLPHDVRKLDRVEAAMIVASREIEILEKFGFEDVVFSLKSSDIETTVALNREFRKRWDYPLHIGVTEAGPLISAVVKSTKALSELIEDGIGDTIRVSISGSCEDEVITAYEILKSCGKSVRRPVVVSCPKCGRARFDADNSFAQELQRILYTVEKDVTVAVMGCEVNGPEEAAHADFGITGVGNSVLFYKKGRLYKKIDKKDALKLLLEEIEKF